MIDRSPMNDPLLERITRTIVEQVHPRRVVLFGSRATRSTDRDSDYDIMVEMESELDPVERVLVIERLFPRRNWSMDILVFTPEEVRQWKDDVGMVLYDVEREGRVLYQRPADGAHGESV